MRYECPEYVTHFKCTADKCTDNCCIGWEIGIDEKTKKKYMALRGELGEKIQKNLDTGETYATFKLCENGRCPMLNNDNLCQIICEVGEGYLSEICREHPRFYNVLPDRIEWGIGLSCEAAAKLILERHKNSVTVSEGEPSECCECDEELFKFLLFARDRIYELIDTSPIPIFKKMQSALYYAEALSEAIDNGEYGVIYPFMPLNEAVSESGTPRQNEIFSELITSLDKLDFLDTDFKNRLKLTAEKIRKNGFSYPTKDAENKLERLFSYFIYRYFITALYDGDVLSKLKLSVILTLIIHAVTQSSDDIRVWINAAKSISREAEYNEENLELLFEMSFTESAFSTKSLLELLS